jgi:3-oxoacyl-[acyl-carrier-protein] synthase II
VTLRRVFVRGVGAVTPLAADWPQSLAALAQGQTAVGPVTAFDVTGFPSTVAACVAAEGGPDRRRLLATQAAREALAMARLEVPAGRCGVFIGAESGRATFATVLALARAAGGGREFDHAAFGAAARGLAERIDASTVSPAAVAQALAAGFAHGPAQTFSLACASGAAAIAEGARAIRLSECDAALCGGVGADVDPLMLAGFGLLGALSARGVSRPFDAHRDGFVVGEGAAMVVLTCEREGALAEVAGAGRTLDAYHLTAPEPGGDGAERAMRLALAQAQLPCVDYVQAHGTSTPLNDAVEAAAIRRVLGADLAKAKVSSVKGALGHWVAGAGAVGFLCAVEAVRSGTVLPTAGLSHPDADCALPHVMGAAQDRRCASALVNAFAFGGANASLVVRRCE